MPQDAIALLKQDHRDVKELFSRFEELSPRAHKRMSAVRDQIVKALSVHAAIEERVLYPVIIESLPEIEETVLEGMQEHAVAEQLLAQVAGMDPEDRWFRPKMSVLAESVRHHIREEEREMFPTLREEFSRAELLELGELLRQERRTAPTTPPPAAKVRALLDSVTERAEEFVNRVRSGLPKAS